MYLTIEESRRYHLTIVHISQIRSFILLFSIKIRTVSNLTLVFSALESRKTDGILVESCKEVYHFKFSHLGTEGKEQVVRKHGFQGN
ncbi:unnamed protein product [Heterobilharzia americana]|nr:unnamed protein product [Heterobilharzia americana]